MSAHLGMAAPATAPGPSEESGIDCALPRDLTCTDVLSILERALHASRAEWLFFRELKLGTGRRNGSLQQLDAFALNTLPHTAMKRVCYEVKLSRADFLVELRHPLKRRIGMRYSNEFYFVTPVAMVAAGEIPPECGLIEVGRATVEDWRALIGRNAGFFHYEVETGWFCLLTIPAAWRDTPGPTWQLAAAMLRNQRRELEERPPAPPAQQRLTLV
jgi:hypothetical protein